MAPDTACPRGGSSGCDILRFESDGDVKAAKGVRLAVGNSAGESNTMPSSTTS